MFTDSWARNSIRAQQRRFIFVSQSLGPQWEDSGAEGWDHLKAHSLTSLLVGSAVGWGRSSVPLPMGLSIQSLYVGGFGLPHSMVAGFPG